MSDGAGHDAAVRVHVTVSGMVQGVGYRYFTVTEARKLGLAGWVRNLMNGDVELEAQGARSDVAMLDLTAEARAGMERCAAGRG